MAESLYDEDPGLSFDRRCSMRRLRRLSFAGLALLPMAPLEAAAQSDSGTLEVLVEGATGADGTTSLTFETRTVPKLDTVDVGPGRSFTDSGQRLGTGAGRVVTPTVTVSKLVTEASEHPSSFMDLTGDAKGRLWAKDRNHEVFVYSGGSSWQRLSPPLYAGDLARDGQGDVWGVGGSTAWHISDSTLTVYGGFKGDLGCFAATGSTLWLGGEGGEGGNASCALVRFDGRDWRRYGLADGLPEYGWVDALAVDSTGTVWAGLISDVAEWDPPTAVYPPPLMSYDGLEWRGYEFSQLDDPGFGRWVQDLEMIVDPGGTLWISDSPRLLHKTGSGWVEYRHSALGTTPIVAERAGRIWMNGYDASAGYRWIGVFESGKLHRTSRNSNPDVLGRARGLYYDGEVLWIIKRRLARWRLPGRSTSIQRAPTHGQSHRSRLLDSYPNPFNADTTIGFELDRRQPVSLRIHNTTGQRVTTLAEGVYPEGVFAVSWDGRDDQGREVASGVYLCRLRLGRHAMSHSLTLVR